MTTGRLGGCHLAQPLVAEVVHVLDEGLHGLARLHLRDLLLLALAALHVVARQRFAQHGHQRSVARQEHGVGAGLLAVRRGDVQPHQRLAGARHAGDEADDLSALLAWACWISASTRRAVSERFRSSASVRTMSATL